MSELDFRKQLLLNEFKTLSQGKKNDEIIPLLFAINDKDKNRYNIHKRRLSVSPQQYVWAIKRKRAQAIA